MWSSVKACALLLLLGACGFQPVYGRHAPLPAGAPIAEGIAISASSADGDAHMAQQFHNNLEDLVHPTGVPSAPLYRLDVTLTATAVGLGVARDGTASRYNLLLDSTYAITRIQDNVQLTHGNIRNVTSYNNPNNQYFSTYVSEQDARKRGITELAEMYRQRLASYTAKTLVPPPVAPAPSPFKPITYENISKVN